MDDGTVRSSGTPDMEWQGPLVLLEGVGRAVLGVAGTGVFFLAGLWLRRIGDMTVGRWIMIVSGVLALLGVAMLVVKLIRPGRLIIDREGIREEPVPAPKSHRAYRWADVERFVVVKPSGLGWLPVGSAIGLDLSPDALRTLEQQLTEVANTSHLGRYPLAQHQKGKSGWSPNTHTILATSLGGRLGGRSVPQLVEELEELRRRFS